MKRGIELSESKTFVKKGKAKEKYNEAYEKNKRQSEIYHCATSRRITCRNLDLKSEYPFCEQSPDKKKANTINEYKIEAFMAKKALSDAGWLLPIDQKKWRLLDAERNFAKADLNESDKGQRLDILAYEADTNSFVVLELKAPGDKQPEKIERAETELETYTGVIRNCLKDANDFYSMPDDDLNIAATQVKGYIVCAAGEAVNDKKTRWGIITYEGELVENDIESITFKIVKDPD